MAIEASYIIQPFQLAKGNRLQRGQAEKAKDETTALRKAERMMQTKAGVVVLREEVDAGADFYGAPVLVAQFGQIPDGLIEGLTS